MTNFMHSQADKINPLESYDIMEKLSSSKFMVYKGYNNNTKQVVALKFFEFQDYPSDRYWNEKEILERLQHPNVLKIIESGDYAMDKTSWQEKHVSYICFEYAHHGDLFKIISNQGKMSEIIARTIFHQLVEAVEYLHKNDLAHLDLKLDNILVNQEFQIKVCDFDLSQSLDSKILKARGTPGSRAPEIKKGICCNLQAADIYSLGTILFILLSGRPAYNEVKKIYGFEFDEFYKLMRINFEEFWETHSKNEENVNFKNPDLKELIHGMLIEEPLQRFTFEEIKNSKWFQGPVLDEKAFQAQMKEYMKPKLNQE